ncbi:MAG: pyridoxal phosphate-dependent aminotransferase [Acidobacteria bacterium]|nr:pyridoxal phosphate-dependent aminotransferase [Acidobacteriota bacterium]
MFSGITERLHGESNDLYRLRDELKKQGLPIQDFISGNINDQGYLFPQDLLEEILVRGLRQCRVYHPDSFGQKFAREAVSEYYRENGLTINTDRILITPGSSLSYWYCFKLLADEGDEILCPCPSYPLFDYIALLSGVKLIPYRLDEARNWSVDADQLEACVSTRTRALVVISPHNPTGHVASAEEIAAIADISRRHDLAIISDEVFSEFLIGRESLPRPAGSDAPLVFTLNGFSKMLALPGIKFGWMAVSGESDRVRKALRSLEFISDTFLPVNEIIQASAPEIFKYGRSVSIDFAKRIRDCWKVAERILASNRQVQFVRPDGGFYVTLRLKNLDEEWAAETILRENHVLLHPGYFYDMAPNHLILSFVQQIETIREFLPKLLETLERQMRQSSAPE